MAKVCAKKLTFLMNYLALSIRKQYSSLSYITSAIFYFLCRISLNIFPQRKFGKVNFFFFFLKKMLKFCNSLIIVIIYFFSDFKKRYQCQQYCTKEKKGVSAAVISSSPSFLLSLRTFNICLQEFTLTTEQIPCLLLFF